MSRENGKNRKGELLVQLGARQRNAKFRKRGFENSQAIDIAKRLGWTTCHENAAEENS